MKYIYIIVLSLVFCLSTFAQVPKSFNYQVLLHDENGELLEEPNVDVDVNLLLGSPNGTVIYSETHLAAPILNGSISLIIGSKTATSGTFNAIKWGEAEIFIQIKHNNHIVCTNLIPAVPLAMHATSADRIQRIAFNQIKNAPDYTNWDKNNTDDFSGDYTDLSNKPSVKTLEESSKLVNIIADSEVDLNQLASNIETNSAIISSPDFGYEVTNIANANRLWKNDDILFYPSNATINSDRPNYQNNIALKINKGIKFHNVPAESVSGAIFYDASINNGTFCYYDESLTLQHISAFESGAMLLPSAYHQVLDDFITQNVVIGDDANLRYQLNGNSMAFVENVLRIRFTDTSSSASFPTNDWQIGLNEIEQGEENCFFIRDIDHNSRPFYISSESTNNELYIAENGNVGLGMNAPKATLDIDGNVEILPAVGPDKHFFIGDASQLTGIDLNQGSALYSNTGSTTIVADDDNDGDGRINFNISENTALIINNTGSISNVNYDGDKKLYIDGTTEIDSIRANRMNTSGNKLHDLNYTYTATGELKIDNEHLILLDSSVTLDYTNNTDNSTYRLITIVNTGSAAIDITVPYLSIPSFNQTHTINPYDKIYLQHNYSSLDLVN